VGGLIPISASIENYRIIMTTFWLWLNDAMLRNRASSGEQVQQTTRAAGFF